MKSRRSGPAQAFLVGIGLLAVIVLALALWQVRWIVLLGFGAILAAILLNAAAWCLRRVLPMGQVSAVILSVTLLILVGVAAFILLGAGFLVTNTILIKRTKARAQLHDAPASSTTLTN